MESKENFLEDVLCQIAFWHGLEPPNAIALRQIEGLKLVIRQFQALCGSLVFEEEPSTFENALAEAAEMKVRRKSLDPELGRPE
jgi:hypothetical protein